MPLKKKIIIFDFNRTIYEPERRRLMPEVVPILAKLSRRGYELHLISTANPSRTKLIRSLGLKKYFRRIAIVRNKQGGFKKITAGRKINLTQSFVVGDRVREEISYGNSLGMKTIWLRSSKFASELPRKKGEKPLYIIHRFSELLAKIK